MNINRILNKKTNRKKGQYRSVFELKICKETMKLTDILVFLLGLSYDTIRYAMDVI